jgi:S-adenosylmethionine decarboxylase proenzyme
MYEFKGKHYLGNFKDCSNLDNIDYVRSALQKSILKCNAKVLDYCDHVFENNGFTCVFLLGESHCSFHSYPEHRSFFIDLFTCGDTCNHEIFHESLNEFFKPEQISAKIIMRG